MLEVIQHHFSPQVEEGWWSGSLNGKTGLFPSNFVKELEITDDGEVQESLEDTGNKMQAIRKWTNYLDFFFVSFRLGFNTKTALVILADDLVEPGWSVGCILALPDLLSIF